MQAHGWHGGHVSMPVMLMSTLMAGFVSQLVSVVFLSLTKRNTCCSVYKGKDEDGTPVIVKVQETSDTLPAWRATLEVRSCRAPSVWRYQRCYQRISFDLQALLLAALCPRLQQRTAPPERLPADRLGRQRQGTDAEGPH